MWCERGGNVTNQRPQHSTWKHPFRFVAVSWCLVICCGRMVVLRLLLHVDLLELHALLLFTKQTELPRQKWCEFRSLSVLARCRPLSHSSGALHAVFLLWYVGFRRTTACRALESHPSGRVFGARFPWCGVVSWLIVPEPCLVLPCCAYITGDWICVGLV